MTASTLFLGIDGGATKCRARLCAGSGARLGEGRAGPANIRLGLETAVAAVLEATRQSLAEAGLAAADMPRIVACLALAGATEPAVREAAQERPWPFARTLVTSDAHAACVGAHGGGDGGVIVVGTGTIGWAEIGGRHHRIGGWGLPLSDEGSGAWLGREALRRVLWAHDGRTAWTALLTALFAQFHNDPHAIVHWAAAAQPHQLGVFAPLIVEHARQADPAAVTLIQGAAGHVDSLAARLLDLGVNRLCVAGGLAAAIMPWLSDTTRAHLVPPAGDALDGAIQLAQAAAAAIDDGVRRASRI